MARNNKYLTTAGLEQPIEGVTEESSMVLSPEAQATIGKAQLVKVQSEGTTKVAVTLPSATVHRLEAMDEGGSRGSVTRRIKSSVDAYVYLKNEIEQGSQVFVLKPDGTPRRIELP